MKKQDVMFLSTALLAVTLVGLLSHIALAEDPPVMLWERRHAGAGGPGELDYGYDIAVDDVGYIYVTGKSNDDIWVAKYAPEPGSLALVALGIAGLFAAKGKKRKALLLVGAPIAFLLMSIAVQESLADVQLLVSGHHTNGVLAFDSATGAFVSDFVAPNSGGLNGPGDLTFGPDGNLYVVSSSTDEVLRYSGITGVFIDTFVTSTGLDAAGGLLFGPDGNLYVGSIHTSDILRYDGSTGAFIDIFIDGGRETWFPYNLPPGAISKPGDVLFGPDGNAYVGSIDQELRNVQRYDGQTGAFIDEFVSTGSGDLNTPHGMVFGPDGDLYVCSYENGKVIQYDGTTGNVIGDFVSQANSGLDGPYDLLFGPDGNLYVASYWSDEVLRYDGQTGAFIDVFASGSGLNGPTGLLFTPEPGMVGLMAVGLAGLFAVRKKKQD